MAMLKLSRVFVSNVVGADCEEKYPRADITRIYCECICIMDIRRDIERVHIGTVHYLYGDSEIYEILW